MTDLHHNSTRLEFRFFRASDEKPAVPASVLIHTLENAQRAIWLIALSQEQKDIKSRARIPDEIQQRYQLKCETPRQGSYIQPAFVESMQPLLEDINPVNPVIDVIETFEAVGVALQNQNRNKVAELIPDTGIRRRVVDAFSQLAPRPGSGWRLDLSRDGTIIQMDDNWQKFIRRMYGPSESEPDRETVNGELIEINFADRQITILPIGSQRQLKVTYPDEMEDFLLENRRSIIQITGRVARDENDEVKNVFDLESIGPLDLSPLEINEVENRGLRLRFKNPLQLRPELNKENPQFLNLENNTLGLEAFAGTVSDLVDEVAEELVFIWNNYALAADEELSPKAIKLKYSLLEAAEEISSAR